MKKPSPRFTILAVGDVNPCRSLAEQLLKEDIGQKRHELSKLFEGGDLVLGNLEGPITDSDQLRPSQVWNLRTPTSLAPLLSVFDGFSLANNHFFDVEKAGLDDTFNVLKELGVKHCGAGHNREEAAQPAIFDVDDFRISMIGFTDRNWYPAGLEKQGTYTWQDQESADVISVLSQDSDFVIVQIHQGYEFMDYPGPEEMLVAQKAIDAGADLILIHHSHYLMGVNRKGKAAVAYGLGDFLLEKLHIPKKYRDKSRRCAIFRFEITTHEVLNWSLIPCVSDKYGWPKLASKDEASSIREYFQTISQVLDDADETHRKFKQQAGKNMLPYALNLLSHVLIQEGPRAFFQRLIRIRYVDLTVLFSYLYRFIQRKVKKG